MPPYAATFSPGATIQIVARLQLETFRSAWHYHHPLTDEQLEWAGRRAVVAEVFYYHGGDPLYSLRDVPGMWHEPCLTAVNERAT